MQDTLSVSERRACRVVGQCRATQQYVPSQADDEEPLRVRIVALAREYGRYGYRRITALLHQEGWRVNHKRWNGSGWPMARVSATPRSLRILVGL